MGQAMYFDQASYDIRCEWGLQGIEALRAETDVFIIVDVLSFSTCVDVAVSQGATVFPYRWKDDSVAAYADSLGAVAASARRRFEGGYSLSPGSLVSIPPGTRLVLPSPNGATLSLATGDTPTLAGCLRNARAVAATAARLGRRISLIPAGERWEDGSLRPALEDLAGAGAIAAHLPGSRSPEAEMAVAAWGMAADNLPATLLACGSGRELVERGFAPDVALAAAHDVSSAAPRLVAGAYVCELTSE
jgi:2-phosphosulfolactate phosphatase